MTTDLALIIRDGALCVAAPAPVTLDQLTGHMAVRPTRQLLAPGGVAGRTADGERTWSGTIPERRCLDLAVGEDGEVLILAPVHDVRLDLERDDVPDRLVRTSLAVEHALGRSPILCTPDEQTVVRRVAPAAPCSCTPRSLVLLEAALVTYYRLGPDAAQAGLISVEVAIEDELEQAGVRPAA